MQYLNRLKRQFRSFNESASGRIMAAALTVAAMSVVVKTVALVKDIVVAHSFGAGDALDAFYVAILLPNFVANIVGESFNAPRSSQFISKCGRSRETRLRSGFCRA